MRRSGSGLPTPIACGLTALALVTSCEGRPHAKSAPSSTRSAKHVPIRVPLAEAPCEIEVFGRGRFDLEESYLPSVVTCEDDGAGPEALRAQAIAARSVAYYAHTTQGGICDGQACQVFSCGREATPAAIQAVRETAGTYLGYGGVLTYGFYVAGDPDTSAPACQGGPRAGTESWVTYNEGRADLQITQTRLGYVHDSGDPGFGQNRGCMSQLGARCLETALGYSTKEILAFYYGQDIELLVAAKVCRS